jgi:hypothetical protein
MYYIILLVLANSLYSIQTANLQLCMYSILQVLIPKEEQSYHQCEMLA